MRPIATDVAWSVCVSASLSVGRNREPHENGSTDRDAIFGCGPGWDQGAMYYVGLGFPREGAIMGMCMQTHYEV